MLVFASEIKSIFTIKDIPREIDPAAMEQIFTFWTTLPGFTAFKGIHELKPGHFMKVSKGEIKTHRYWDIPLAGSKDHVNWSTDQISEHVSELLLDSVRMRLRADVPVGSYLSGGLDSSGITSMIVRNFDNDVKTFGIRFQEQEFDEGTHQREMVEYLSAKHSEMYATNDKIGNALPNVVFHAEKPLLRTSPIPLYLLSQLVRDSDLKVVLTGEGADEIFGGYNIFREAKIRRFLARFPDSEKRLGLIAQLYPYIFSDPRLKSSIQAFFAKGLDDAQGPLFSHLLRWKNTSRIKTFFSEDMKHRASETDVFQQVAESIPTDLKESDYLAKAQYLEMSIFMSNYLLSSQGDRVAMANSVEIRLPYLDPNIMEFMASVPARWKILGLTEKHLLKKVFTPILPKSIIERKKHPYRAPIVKSLLCSNAFDYSAEMLSDTAITRAGIFNPKKVSKLVNKVKTASTASEIDSMALVGILSTQLINNSFIENFTPPPKSEQMPDLLVDQRKHVVQNR
jgi:asparagine synthase (glutamine-hydrolysing)